MSQTQSFETIGETLKRLRVESGYSLRSLASISKVSARSISYYESDEQIPSDVNAAALAKAFDMDVIGFVDRVAQAREDKYKQIYLSK